MGKDNTIIGGEIFDTIMNRGMALADVFYTRSQVPPDVKPENTPPNQSVTDYNKTRVIIDSKDHGAVDWTVMNWNPKTS